LVEDDYYFFIYDSFYEELKRGDWIKERSRTATMIGQYFGGEFNYQKRFPQGNNEKPFSPLRVLKLPKEGLEKEEIQDEFIKQENKETIV